MAVYYPRAKVNLQVLFEGFGGPDEYETLQDIDPASYTVHLNSYKEADTFEVTFDLKFFPFSPELIRSAEVEIYAYQASDATAGTVWMREENLLCVGLVDEISMSQGDDGGTVTLSGRDYTSILLDRPWVPAGAEASGARGRIPVGKSLADTIQQLVDEGTGYRKRGLTDQQFAHAPKSGKTLTVEILDGAVDPVTGKVASGVTQRKTTTKVGAAKSTKKKKGITVKADQSYWDTIYKLALSYGFVVFVKGRKVILSKPHVLQASAQGAAHRVAWGRNLSSLTVDRKLSKEAVPQIVVRSSADKNGRVVEGRYPSSKDKTTNAIGLKKDEFRVYTVGDVQDPEILRDIAETTYYTIARGEGSITFSTHHLDDLPDANDTTRSMLALRPGDPVRIEWDAFNADLMLNKDVSAPEKISYLQGLGYSLRVAQIVADQYAKLDYFRQPFYTKEIEISWSATDGLSFDVTATNFINVKSTRNDP